MKGPVYYNYGDLKSATKNFSIENKLGEGGFGVVYKVTIYLDFTYFDIYHNPKQAKDLKSINDI